MKTFDYNEYLKNNPLLKEEDSVEQPSQIDPNETHYGESVDRGPTGSSISFKVIKNNPDNFTIDYVIKPNSRFMSKSAAGREKRVPVEGQAVVKKDNPVQKDYIKVAGQSFQIGNKLANALYAQ